VSARDARKAQERAMEGETEREKDGQSTAGTTTAGRRVRADSDRLSR
jgi:hypothetical protein